MIRKAQGQCFNGSDAVSILKKAVSEETISDAFFQVVKSNKS